MHLPRIIWDNPQPPVKAEKIEDLNIIRREALVYLTKCILGKSSVVALMRWGNELGYPLIPRKYHIVDKSFVQMNSLSASVYWSTPRNILISMNYQSILVHWRDQAALVQYLWQPQLEIYLRVGSSFMSDIYNLTGSLYHYARERSLLAIVVWKYCQSTVSYGTQPSDDEADDAQVATPITGQIHQPAEDWEKETTIVPEPHKRRVVYWVLHSD
jgi:hypothetical protein